MYTIPEQLKNFPDPLNTLNNTLKTAKLAINPPLFSCFCLYEV